MRKVLLALSAFAVFGLVAPLTTPAKAEERVVIKEHRDHPRFVERFHHRDFDRFRHHERGAVIIKKRREY
jgi:Ni/Co efflux regulator RcnB